MKNIFQGTSLVAQYARIIYEMLLTGHSITYAMVVQRLISEELSHQQENPDSRTVQTVFDKKYCGQVSNFEHYTGLKKAFCQLVSLIGKDAIVVEGSNRNRSFRLLHPGDDPLADLTNRIIVDNTQRYLRFYQDSTGFVPDPWLDHYFKNSREFLNVKRRKVDGSRVIFTDANRVLKNLDMLPILYDHIIAQHVLEIDYQPFGREAFRVVLHPHCLKEFNGRWFLFGRACTPDHETQEGFQMALDRIQGVPQVTLAAGAYIPPSPMDFYRQLFADMVGVSTGSESPTEVVVRAHSQYMFLLTKTKPLHASQTVLAEYDPTRDYGDFLLRVKVNKELIGYILQMGPDLEVLSPESLREEVRRQVEKMADRYRNGSTD